ncbi:MAG: hypothetical protein ACOX2I_12785 [Candidatus Ozemobacteraceae bacterium]|nr:hypothetical protein [Candidatus Riflebacteria bacterium]
MTVKVSHLGLADLHLTSRATNPIAKTINIMAETTYVAANGAKKPI